ncbi:putative zinc finger protein [Kribbella orskensis]|uniref:Zinc finger protein n=1 Tax=Kribbella orskensis TaxID=2512216 RepID=A0ABY2BIM8_9ACTN|nr:MULTISPECIES: zf-HC2 domain-containing protein [Kribbella]TCN37892.1 putative zinc finger protein [Kribbella sp. VKM Ac-2500]TCO19378.1 putative zinc finger protein [Kribbella orskensis]
MNDLDCQQFVEQVTSFLEGDLGPDAEQSFIDHLALCDGCDRYLDQVRQTVQALEGLPADSISPTTRTALLDAFRSQT